MADADRDKKTRAIFAGALSKAGARHPRVKFDLATRLGGGTILISLPDQGKSFRFSFVVKNDDSILAGTGQDLTYRLGKTSDENAEEAIANAIGIAIVKYFG